MLDVCPLHLEGTQQSMDMNDDEKRKALDILRDVVGAKTLAANAKLSRQTAKIFK